MGAEDSRTLSFSMVAASNKINFYFQGCHRVVRLTVQSV